VENLELETATFRSFDESTPDDMRKIAAHMPGFLGGLPDRVLAHMQLLAGDYSGMLVDRLTHCLQTATRAYRANRDDELVFCALIHDIGDTLGAYNHADVAAAIIKPFVSEDRHWLIANHTIFQGYHFLDKMGLDRNLRDVFRGHHMFDQTAEFCADYDQPAFDPDYDTLPLEHFAPLVHTIMSKPREDNVVLDKLADSLEPAAAGPAK
jgi:predicted HD phosphohydrolase